jgi:hypothetical protein
MPTKAIRPAARMTAPIVSWALMAASEPAGEQENDKDEQEHATKAVAVWAVWAAVNAEAAAEQDEDDDEKKEK